MAYLLLTGCTGLVGRYLLRDLLASDVPVAVIVRPDKVAGARQRVEGVMSHWEREAGRAMARPVVLEGDLCQAGVVSTEQREWLTEHCQTLLHCAASMTFRENQRGEPFRTNVEGTRNVLQLCRDTGINRLHYVSTAYICGLRQGRVLETEVDLGQELGNVYEQSKLQAEKMVRQANFLDETTFYRPASVIGDSRTGYVTSYHGFYLPLQLAYIMAGRIPPQAMNERFFARLGLRGDEGKNLVPVDWLSEAITYLVTHPQHHGKTYHLASPQPVQVREIQRVVRDAIQEHSRRTLAKSASEAELQGYEGLFHEYMSVYRSHWRDDPVFDISQSRAALAHLPCPPMDYPLLMRAARYPVERDFSLNTHERIELDLGTERHLERLFTTPHQPSSQSVAGDGDMVGLQITGCGGGQWHLLVRGGRLAGAGVGLPPGNAARFYLSASTFRSLVDGQRTVEDSINTGGVVVEGGPGGLDNLVDVLEQVVAT